MNTVHTEPVHQMGAIEHLVLAMRIASTAVISDIETNAICVTLDGATWWDVRPMLDEREQPPECVDMSRQAIAYALDAQIVEQHPAQPHMLRINRPIAS